MAEISSLPPKAICILWKSFIPSWPDDEEQNKSINRATETERCGRDGDTLLAMDTSYQDSVPIKMRKYLIHFRLGDAIQWALRGSSIGVIGEMAMFRQGRPYDENICV